MPIGKFKSILRDKKDHFVITLYKKIRKKFNINQDSILLLKINNNELIRMPTKNDFHITIPKRFINNTNAISVEIFGVYGKERAKLRDKILFYNNLLNLKAIIPIKTIFGKQIFILEDKDYVRIWYPIGGGANHIKIKKEIDVVKISELVGFYFGDGSTSKGIRSFRLNNCEPSILNYCLNVLEEIGIARDRFKVQVIYSTNKEEITDHIKKRCIYYWSQILSINKDKIVSVNKSKNGRETLKYGSARVFIDNAVLVEIFLNGILKEFLKIIQKPKNKLENNISAGFLRGLLAAEGSIILRKNSLSSIGIAFNPHNEDVDLYKNLLSNLGLSWTFIHGNELVIHKFKNFKRLFELDAFKLHDKRNEKFMLGFKNHKYFKTKS